MCPALGLGRPGSPAWLRKSPWEGPLGDQRRVTVSPQEAGRSDPPAVFRAERQVEVRALTSGNVGPSALGRGAIKGRQGL